MTCSKPITIRGSGGRNSLDYNVHCQGYKSMTKPNYMSREMGKTSRPKPRLLEHPSILPNFNTSTGTTTKPSIFENTYKNTQTSPLPQSCVALVHEDELLEEMKEMIKNHRLAKQIQKENTLQNTLSRCQNEDLRRLFVSNALTMKFLEEQDVVLITVSEELLISQLVEANLHLRVGKIVQKCEFSDECCVELFNTQNESCCGEIVTVPSFCLCLEDRVLFDRMKSKRNNIILKRQCRSVDELSSLSFQFNNNNTDNCPEKCVENQQSKPKRKFKSC